MNNSLSRWAAALLVLSPILLVLVGGIDAPAVGVDNLTEAREDLVDIDDNRAGLLALVAFEMLAGAAIVAAASFLAGRLHGAPALANAGLVLAAMAAALIMVTAAIEIALIVRVAEAVADGDTSSSTALLGQAMYEVYDSMVFVGVVPAAGLWVTLTSVAMLRTGVFPRRAAYVGLAVAPLILLGAMTFAVGIGFVFIGLGALLIIVWSVWLALSMARQPTLP